MNQSNTEYEVKRCPICTREFKAYNPKKKFCTDRCRSENYNKNHVRVPINILKPNNEPEPTA